MQEAVAEYAYIMKMTKDTSKSQRIRSSCKEENTMDQIRQLESDLAVARRLAEEAGEIIKARWGTELKLEHKGVVDLVGEVDLAAEAHILRGLHTPSKTKVMAEEESSGQTDKLQRHFK